MVLASFLARVGRRWARRVCAIPEAPGPNSMPDYGFGRCDGHHEMVDLRLRKKLQCASFATTTARGCGVDWRGLGNPRGNGMARGNATEKRRSSSNSHQDDVEVSGHAIWGSYDRQRVKWGAIHVGELNGKGRPRGRTLAIGYDPDRSGFPPARDEARDDCAAKLQLYGRYLVVEDDGTCGGLNVSFIGIYVRVKSLKDSAGFEAEGRLVGLTENCLC